MKLKKFLSIIYNKVKILFKVFLNNFFLRKFEYKFLSNYNFKNTTLSKLCDKYGSDKGYNDLKNRIFYNNWHPHNYTDYYSSLFDHNRQYVKRVFECGIGTNNPKLPSSMGAEYAPGASLKMWRDYFPKAEIYGADLDKEILFEEDRIKTFYVNQLNKDDIKNMWSEIGLNNFDLIIDDGLHTFEAGICLFNNSFDKLRAGGIYIIEDVDPSYLNKLSQYFYPKFNFEIIRLRSRSKKLLQDNNLLVIRK